MGKVVKWLGLMGGVTLLFYLGGMISGTATSTLLDLMLNPSNIETSNMVLKITSISILVISAVSTFVTRNQNSDFALIFPITAILLSFGWDFLTVFMAIRQTSTIGAVIGGMIFGPMLLMYTISVVEWWRGIEA